MQALKWRRIEYGHHEAERGPRRYQVRRQMGGGWSLDINDRRVDHFIRSDVDAKALADRLDAISPMSALRYALDAKRRFLESMQDEHGDVPADRLADYDEAASDHNEVIADAAERLLDELEERSA